MAQSPSAVARDSGFRFQAGNLLVSRLVYDNNPNTVVAGTTALPPGCASANCVTATDSGAYPGVWNNDLVDGNFGITVKIVLDQLSPSGRYINSLPVSDRARHWRRRGHGTDRDADQMVGSFSSRSDGALNLSVDGRSVSLMAYLAPVDALSCAPVLTMIPSDCGSIAHYPSGANTKTGLPWAPATDGLRNITGRVNRDGTVSIWAITSTVSGSGDQGADPNKLVTITDKVAATSLPSGQNFKTLRSARFGEVLRGVSMTPGTRLSDHWHRHRETADASWRH